MADGRRLTSDQWRLLHLVGRMPLASAAELAPIMAVPEDRLAARLARLRRNSWLGALRRGMSVSPRPRWFLTGQAVTEPYTTRHTRLAPRDLDPGDVLRQIADEARALTAARCAVITVRVPRWTHVATRATGRPLTLLAPSDAPGMRRMILTEVEQQCPPLLRNHRFGVHVDQRQYAFTNEMRQCRKEIKST